ncbi:LysR substrate-binding domain-containing protein [Edwardsiella anguillarum]|nr:LysR substrate-binding domain-containing protein [Edwardsiella anguillarum]
MPSGRFHTNDAQTLLSWLNAGAGITYLPLMWVIDAVRRKEVEILFPSTSPPRARCMRCTPKGTPARQAASLSRVPKRLFCPDGRHLPRYPPEK